MPWPRTLIGTAALRMVPGLDPRACRTPEIVADAAHWILTRAVSDIGRFYIDEEALAEAGIVDFTPTYSSTEI